MSFPFLAFAAVDKDASCPNTLFYKENQSQDCMVLKQRGCSGGDWCDRLLLLAVVAECLLLIHLLPSG